LSELKYPFIKLTEYYQIHLNWKEP
jgi:hypothetical protein